jgi:hypothetical protein
MHRLLGPSHLPAERGSPLQNASNGAMPTQLPEPHYDASGGGDATAHAPSAPDQERVTLTFHAGGAFEWIVCI